MREPIPFRWKGNHHLYYGISFLIFGVYNTIFSLSGGLPQMLPCWYLIIGVGIFAIIDDIIEHTITADTPLRLLYEHLFKIE